MNLIKVSRPIFWPVGVIAFLTGFVYSGAGITFLAVIQAIMMSFPLSMITFGINDIYDYKTDKLNSRKKNIEGVVLEKKDHKKVLYSVKICVSFVLSISLVTFNLSNIISVFCLLFFAVFYSAPVFRLKERPPFDSISNGLMAFFAFMVGFSHGKPFFAIDLKIALAALCFCGMHAFTTLADYAPDKKAGQKTFAVVFGKRASCIFPLVVFLIAYFFGRFSSYISVFLFVSSLVFFLNSIKPSEKLAEVSSKLIYVLGIVISAMFFVSNVLY